MSPPNAKERKVISMTDEEIKEVTKKNLAKLDNHINLFEAAERVVKMHKVHAIHRQLHQRAINATKALDGLEGLLTDLRSGRLLCMEILGAKNVPIINQDNPKLELVVDNERR